MSAAEPTPEESWQVTWHEAAHAVAAVRLKVSFEFVERFEGDSAKIELTDGPYSPRLGPWEEKEIENLQLVYVAGEAGDLMLYGMQRKHVYRMDRRLHKKMEEKRAAPRNEGWAQDVEAVSKILDREAIEKVAGALDQSRRLDEEEVYELLGIVRECDQDE